MTTEGMEGRHYTVREAAAKLGKSKNGVLSLIRRGVLIASRIATPERGGVGFSYLIRAKDVDGYAADTAGGRVLLAPAPGRRLTVPQASVATGLSAGAVYGRIKSGTVDAKRDEVGRLTLGLNELRTLMTVVRPRRRMLPGMRITVPLPASPPAPPVPPVFSRDAFKGEVVAVLRRLLAALEE